MGGYLVDVGRSAADVVFYVSDTLRADHTPGVVAVGLVVSLAAVLGHLGWRWLSRRHAIRQLQKQLDGTANEVDFNAQIDVIENALGGAKGPKARVRTAWKEYRETFVPHEEAGKTVQRNAVRPSQFFNVDDLGFGPGYWRIVPGLFVTVGLFLTFLGLVSALHSMDSDEGISEEAMTNLLSVASAKFIMSLTGLLCSIFFTLCLRVATESIEAHIHQLNVTFEDRLTFISLEDLAVEQLAVLRENREHSRSLVTELVAELDRPLREELPAAIGASVKNAVEPLAQQIGQVGSEGLGDMVRDLSTRFTQDVNGALGQASDRLGEAADRIGGLVDRMDQSSGAMGREMEGAIGRLGSAIEELRATMAAGADHATEAFGQGVDAILSAMNETLVGIRQNTADGATALREAAQQMRTAAESIRNELEVAAREAAAAAERRLQNSGLEVSEAISGAGVAIFRTTEEAAVRARQELLEPMGALAAQLDALVGTLTSGTQQLGHVAAHVRTGADATADASRSFRDSARSLVQATSPVRESVDKLRASTEHMVSSTRNVAESTRANVDSARQALTSANDTLGGSQRVLVEALREFQQVAGAMRGQGDRLDDIDIKLGQAFEIYRDNVQRFVDELGRHVDDIQKGLTPALNTMLEITDRQEQFRPASRRR